MKTLTKINNTRCCDRCKVKDKLPHPLYICTVTLKEFGPKLLCQSCLIKAEVKTCIQKTQKTEKSSWWYLSQRKLNHWAVSARYFLFFGLYIFLSESVMAQPPGLPGSPEQAPIDGGLALLAAAGGAYAIKKLRDRKE